MDHLLVGLTVAVGQGGEGMANLMGLKGSNRGFSMRKILTISRTHLSLYLAAAMAVLPGPAGAPCIVAALACRKEHILILFSVLSRLDK